MGLVALALLTGAWVLRLFPLPLADGYERSVFAAGLGFGVLSFAGFGLGILGVLSPLTVRVTLGILLLTGVAASRIPRTDHPPRGSQKPLPGPVHPSWSVLLFAFAAIALLAALLASSGPMVEYDGLAYHVAAPKRWLEVGAIRALPTHLQAEWPMGFEMLNMLLLPIAGPDASRPLMVLAGLLTAIVAYCLGRRLANAAVGLTAAALWILIAGIEKLNTTSVEAALALFVALTGLALAIAGGAENMRDRRSWIVLAAVMAGLANCMKLNGLLCAAIAAIVVLVLPRPSSGRAGARERLGDGVGFLLLSALIAAPWYWRTWRDTGSPFYPFAYPVFGGRDWNSHAAAVLQSYFHYFDLPGDTLAARHAIVVKHVVRFAALAAAALLPSPRWVRALTLLAAFFAVIQVSISDQWRFLLPALPFAAVAAAWWIALAAQRWPAAGWVAAGGIGLLSLRSSVATGSEAISSAFRGTPRVAVLRRYLNSYDVCLWANRHLAGDARIFCGLDSRTYYLERDTYWSEAVTQQQIRYDDPALFGASLRRAGITHFLFNRSFLNVPELQFEVRVGWRADEERRLLELASQSTLLWSASGAELYKLPADMTAP